MVGRGHRPPATPSLPPQVTAYEEDNRDGPLPRLLHSANTSKVEFTMEGVAPRGNYSRFALEILAVEEGSRGKQLQSARSIDDEYTPTIFEVWPRHPLWVQSRVCSLGFSGHRLANGAVAGWIRTGLQAQRGSPKEEGDNLPRPIRRSRLVSSQLVVVQFAAGQQSRGYRRNGGIES